MNQYLIDKLREGRLNKQLKQSDVTKLTGIKNTTLSNYENGNTEPDMDTFLKLCDLYDLDYAEVIGEAYGYKIPGIDFDIKKSDIDFLKNFHALDPYGQETILYLLDRETKRVAQLNERKDIRISDGKKIVPEDIANPKLIKLPYLHKIASAGKGNYIFTDIPVDMKEVISNDISEQSDYAIGVDGNSMYPSFTDGDIVLVKKAAYVPVGNVGLFKHNNEIIIKRVGEDRLISDNHNGYKDIFPDAGEIECLGEVTGKLIGNEVISEDDIEMLDYAASHFKKPKISNGN